MEQILKNVKHGTYADPQESATIFLLCSAVEGEEEMTLRGPGVDGELKVKVYPYIKKVIRLRSDLEIEYPLGVDLVFIDGSGKMIGVPRLVKID